MHSVGNRHTQAVTAWFGRSPRGLLPLFISALVFLVLTIGTVSAQSVTPDSLLAEINKLRTAQGLTALTANAELQAIVNDVASGKTGWPGYEEIAAKTGQPAFLFGEFSATTTAAIAQAIANKKPEVLSSEYTELAIAVAYGKYFQGIIGVNKDLRCNSVADPAFQAQIAGGVLSQVNALRASLGAPPLVLNDALNTAARLHSEDMAKNNFFSHNNLQGEDPSVRVIRQGYSYYSGENIAKNPALNAEAPYQQWLNSPPHYANMTNPGSNEMGLGVGGCGDFIYYTQLFGSSPNASTATSPNTNGAGANTTTDSNTTTNPPSAITPEDLVAQFNTLPNTKLALSPNLNEIARAWGQDKVDAYAPLAALPGRGSINYFMIPLLGTAEETVAEYAKQNGAESLSRFNVMGVYKSEFGSAYLTFARLRDTSVVGVTAEANTAVTTTNTVAPTETITGASIVTEINNLRTAQGLTPLTVTDALSGIATTAVTSGGLLPDTTALGKLSPKYNYAFGSSKSTTSKDVAQDLTTKNPDLLLNTTYTEIGLEYANGRYTLVVIKGLDSLKINCATANLSDSPLAGDVLALVNGLRQQQGLKPLVLNGTLSSVGSAHSQDMATNNYFSHYSQNGASPTDRLALAGYSESDYYIGENIAKNYILDANAVYTQWFNSPGHYANMVKPEFTDMGLGIGCASDYYYFTQVFIGAPSSEPIAESTDPNATTTDPNATTGTVDTTTTTDPNANAGTGDANANTTTGLTGTIFADGFEGATLRSGAGGGFTNLGTVLNNTVVQVLQQDTATGWTQIRTPEGQEGWVLSGAVRDIAEGAVTAPETTTNNGATDPNANAGTGDTNTGTTDANAGTGNANTTTGLTGTILADGFEGATLRSGAGGGFANLGMVLNNTVVQVLQQDTNIGWTQIRTPDGQEGWVLSGAVRNITEAVVTAPDTTTNNGATDPNANAGTGDTTTPTDPNATTGTGDATPPVETVSQLASLDDIFNAMNARPNTSLTRASDIETFIADSRAQNKGFAQILGELKATEGIKRVSLLPLTHLPGAEETIQSRTADGFPVYNAVALVNSKLKDSGKPVVLAFLLEREEQVVPLATADDVLGYLNTLPNTSLVRSPALSNVADTLLQEGKSPNDILEAVRALPSVELANLYLVHRLETAQETIDSYLAVNGIQSNVFSSSNTIILQEVNIPGNGEFLIMIPVISKTETTSDVLENVAPADANTDANTGTTDANTGTTDTNTGTTDTNTGTTETVSEPQLASLDDFFALINDLPETNLVRRTDIEASFAEQLAQGVGVKTIIEGLRSTPGYTLVNILPSSHLETAEAIVASMTARYGDPYRFYNNVALVSLKNVNTGKRTLFSIVILNESQDEVVDPNQPPAPPEPTEADTKAEFSLADFLAQLNAQSGTTLTYTLEMELVASAWARENTQPSDTLNALPGAPAWDAFIVPVTGSTEDLVAAVLARAGSLADYNTFGVFRSTLNEDSLYVVLANIISPETANESFKDTVVNNQNEELIVPPFQEEEPLPPVVEQLDEPQVGTGEGDVNPDANASGDPTDESFSTRYFNATNAFRIAYGLPSFSYSDILQQASILALSGDDVDAFLVQNGIQTYVVLEGGHPQVTPDQVEQALFTDTIDFENDFANADYNAMAVGHDESRYFMVFAKLSADDFAVERGETPIEEDEDAPKFSTEYLTVLNQYRELNGFEPFAYSPILQEAAILAVTEQDVATFLQQQGISVYRVMIGTGTDVTVEGAANAVTADLAVFPEVFNGVDFNAIAIASIESGYYLVAGNLSPEQLANEGQDQQNNLASIDSDADGLTDDIDVCPLQGDLGFGIDPLGCPISNTTTDTDGDGLTDDVDACPTSGDLGFGLDATGCPMSNAAGDFDSDGFADDFDVCPEEGDQGFGVDSFGCPIPAPAGGGAVDSDGDGFTDDLDRCAFNSFDTIDGCSTVVDNDGDGYFDSDDECPYEFVTPENDDFVFPGCPKP